MAKAAADFLQTLSAGQKDETLFAFDDSERYNWHYIPKTRKGLTLNEMDDKQRKAAFALLHTALSDTGFNKATAVMQLENVLKEIENRLPTITTVTREIIIFLFLETRQQMQSGDGDWKGIIFLLIFLLKTIS